MSFDTLFKLGATSLLVGLLAMFYFYVSCRKAFPPERAPSIVRYFGVGLLIGLGAYIASAAIGIYSACSSPAAGDLCGLYGVFGVGPLVAGIALFLYGVSWRKRATRGH